MHTNTIVIYSQYSSNLNFHKRWETKKVKTTSNKSIIRLTYLKNTTGMRFKNLAGLLDSASRLSISNPFTVQGHGY